jgi:hypothetical protein
MPTEEPFEVLEGDQIPFGLNTDTIDDIDNGKVIKSTISRLAEAGIYPGCGTIESFRKLVDAGFGDRQVIAQYGESPWDKHRSDIRSIDNMPWIEATEEEAQRIQEICGLRADGPVSRWSDSPDYQPEYVGFYEFEDE